MITRSVLNLGRLCRARFSTANNIPTQGQDPVNLQQYNYNQSNTVAEKFKADKKQVLNLYGALGLAFFIPYGGVAALPLIMGACKYLQVTWMERSLSQMTQSQIQTAEVINSTILKVKLRDGKTEWQAPVESVSLTQFGEGQAKFILISDGVNNGWLLNDNQSSNFLNYLARGGRMVDSIQGDKVEPSTKAWPWVGTIGKKHVKLEDLIK